MYLYFNKQGVLTTVIPHGEPVRQGSYLNISVCLDLDTFVSKEDSINYNCNVELSFPNQSLGTHNISISGPIQEEFQKTNDSEITYDLIPGNDYWVYKFRFTPEQSTFNAGKLYANVSFEKVILEQDTSVEDLQYNGTAEIYVEKTFGYAKRILDESGLHYKNLVAMINDLSLKKVNKEGNNVIVLNKNSFDEIFEDYSKNTDFSQTNQNLIKNNKYQLVKLLDGKISYNYYLISNFISNSMVSSEIYYFICLKGNTTISLLTFSINSNTTEEVWTLYNDVEFAEKEYVDNQLKQIKLENPTGSLSNNDYNLIKTFSHVLIEYNDKIYRKSKSSTENQIIYINSNVNQDESILNESIITITPTAYNIVEKNLPILNDSNKIDEKFLPSYVDDVIEGYYKNGEFYSDIDCTILVPREKGKMYLDLFMDGELYRWTGTRYLKLPTNINGEIVASQFIKVNEGRYEAAYYSESENNYVEGTTLHLSNFWSVKNRTLQNDSDVLVEDEILDID